MNQRSHLTSFFLLWLLVLSLNSDFGECARGGGGGGRRGGGRKGTKYGMRMPILIRPRNQEAGNYYEHKDGARIIKSSHFELDYMLGRKITFFCMAKGLPRPEITWFKDGIELYAHKFFQKKMELEKSDEKVKEKKQTEETVKTEEEEDEREDKGEDDDYDSEKNKDNKSYVGRFFDEKYGEEFRGEDYYSPPPDFSLFMGPVDSMTGQEPVAPVGIDEKPEFEERDEYEPGVQELKGEESILGEEAEDKSDTESQKPSLTTISSYEYGTRVSEYFARPKEKTPSELQFEADYREVVEEKMKKILHLGGIEEEKDDKTDKRVPIEKKKLLITEVDVSGLYPMPKTIESEPSFMFDEGEDMEKGPKKALVQMDLIHFIMDALMDSLKFDTESIFAKNQTESIQKVRDVVEEIVTLFKKGATTDIAQKVNESLMEFKPNLRNTLIVRLKEKLTSKSLTEVQEEEEAKAAEALKEQLHRVKKRRKVGPGFKKEALRVEKSTDTLRDEISKESELWLGEEEEEEEELEEELVEEEKKDKVEEEEIEGEAVIQYEKIDWQQYLTESERQLALDPALKLEMDSYIKQRKEELEKEQKAVAEKRGRKLKYKFAKDPQELLKNINLNVTMKFVLNTGDIFTCAYRYFMSFKEIKEDLAGIFKVPSDVFVIYRDEVEVKDEETAFDLIPEIKPFESVTFRLLTLDNDRWKLKSDHLDLPVPDIITCTVEAGKDHEGTVEYKDVVVEIENRTIKKPFVGGYRDCTTGIEYHHAFSQSAPHPPKLPWEKRVSRDTQTAFTGEKVIDTVCDKSTQMARRDYYVSTDTDKIITPKPYVDYDSWYKQKDFDGKIRTIQRYVRAMILRKFLKQMSEEYRKRKCWEILQEKKRLAERENRIKADIINMTYPKSRADFDMLYELVEKWRKAQVERISQLKTEAPKKAELCSVLEKEIKLLEAIEVHRIAVSNQQKKAKTLNFMEKVSKPVTWTGYRGITIKMDTLRTQRARELKELYQSLSRHELDHQQRIELLVSLKHALREQNTRMAEELTDLINQEIELLIRGVRPKDLEYLRRRIEHLFGEFFKDPSVNPEAAKYDPVLNKTPLKNNILFCKLCHQMKLLQEFSATTRDVSIKVCSSCRWVHNIAVPRVDLGPYRYILKKVRQDEQKRNCYSSCAFILQDDDMRFLVQNIWRNRSILSENDNLIDLRMPRYDQSKDWTPWNCILLTELEAKAHLKTAPEDNYEPQLIGEMISKHEMAKRHFQQLFSTVNRICDSGKWANVVDLKKYLPLPTAADGWDAKPVDRSRIKETCAYLESHQSKIQGSQT